MTRRILAVASAAMGFVVLAARAPACPFCDKMGKPLSESVLEADLVALGWLEEGAGDDRSRFRVKERIHGPADLANGTAVDLTRRLPEGAADAPPRILFAHRTHAGFDPYRWMRIDSPRVAHYLKEVVRLYGRPAADRLGFFFEHLADSDPTIAEDAYKEFARADYRDVRAAAGRYDPDRLLDWLRDPATLGRRAALYGLLLGVHGDRSRAAPLVELLDSGEPRLLVGLDGLLAGLCLLDPKRGLERTLGELTDPKGTFARRYAALAAVRFLLAEVPSADRGSILRSLEDALAIPEIADLAMDELRKEEAWSALPRVLSANDASPVARAAAIRFALACPRDEAREFLSKLRELDAGAVADAEQALRFERQIAREAAAATANRPTPSP